MEIKKIVGISILSASMLGLWGCSSHSAASNHPAASSGQNGSASSADNGSQNNQSGQSGNTKKNSGGKSDSTPSQKGSSDSSSPAKGDTGQSKPAPASQQEALNQAAAALNTKVPIMLPTNVPLSKGKNLTASTKSEQWYYQTKLYGTDKPATINSQSVEDGSLIATVEGTEYKDAASAKKSIPGYRKVDTSSADLSIDLGHGIAGTSEGAAGHAYVSWNEGRWSININSPTDPSYATEQYKDSKKLAEQMVAYLNKEALPAPQSIGVITVSNWKKSMKTTVQWQFHEMTYKVTSQDPMDALKVAVAMKFESK